MCIEKIRFTRSQLLFYIIFISVIQCDHSVPLPSLPVTNFTSPESQRTWLYNERTDSLTLRSGGSSNSKSGCKITTRRNFPNPVPLILNHNYTFLYPTSKNGEINFHTGDAFLLACPGKNNYLTELTRSQNQMIYNFTCTRGDLFETNRIRYRFNQLRCRRPPASSARVVGECFGGNLKIFIGFSLAKFFVPQITVCFNWKKFQTLYTYFELPPGIKGQQKGIPRPPFATDIFYNNTDVNSLYLRKNQRTVLTKLIESEHLAEEYAPVDSNDVYLARGHLAAKSDFIYAPQQFATFYYINAAPQWQRFNGGNWAQLENQIRNFVSDVVQDVLEVYTGVYNITTLPTINDNDVPLFLSGTDLLPVPKYFWKVVVHQRQNKAIAFVGLNNIFSFNNETDVFCEDICDEITWVNESSWDSVEVGYIFCCDVNEFRKTVNFMPKINFNRILN